MITLIDSEGTIVARAPEAEKWVSRNLRGTGIVDKALAQKHGVSEALSSTGIRRVFGVAPVAGSGWHAIAHRPYRSGLGIDKALDEITKNRGRLYNSGAVDACVRLFVEKRYAFG